MVLKLNRLWSLLLLLMGIVMLSLSPIFTKFGEADIGANATILDRYGIAFFILAIGQGIGASLQLMRPGFKLDPLPFEAIWQIPYNPADIRLFLAEGILGLTCIWLWTISLTQTSVANSNLLHNLTPVFTALGGIFFLGQTVDRRFAWGLGCAVVATAGLQWQDFNISLQYFWGDCLALLSAVFYAAGFLIREELRERFQTTTILFWNCLCRSSIALAVVLVLGEPLFPVTGLGWGAVLGLGVLVQLMGQGVLIYALKKVSANFASLCLLLDPILAALLAWFLLGERISVWNGIAFTGVLGGIYFAATSQQSFKALSVEDRD